MTALGPRGRAVPDVDKLAGDHAQALNPGDHALIMSNGGFGGLHGKLLANLEARFGRN
jgi:UDP-N-acetylmuramate: L-alanyl-gamma-D-glutamyl-meso-diaminopimelate ligase